MNASEELLAKFQTELSQLLIESSATNNELLDFPEDLGNHEQLAIVTASLLAEANTHFLPEWSAHMSAPIKFSSLTGVILAGLHGGNLLSPQLYPILADCERQLLQWLCSFFEQQYGHFVPGGSYGNLEALWQAKQSNPERRSVYCSTATHYSIAKACQVLELELVTVDTNNEEQIDIQALEQACLKRPPLAIVATAGTTSRGSFDPLEKCLTITKKFGSWLHIDAAWGGGLKILPECEVLFEGIPQADSLSFDPHKLWGQPKPCSIVFYQKPLAQFLSAESHYLSQNPDQRLSGSYGGENFLPLYLSLISAGTEPLIQELRHNLKQAELFASLLKQHSDWPVFTSPSGIVCFECPHSLDKLIAKGIVSTTSYSGKTIYRAVFLGETVSADAIFTQLQHYL